MSCGGFYELQELRIFKVVINQWVIVIKNVFSALVYIYVPYLLTGLTTTILLLHYSENIFNSVSGRYTLYIPLCVYFIFLKDAVLCSNSFVSTIRYAKFNYQ